MPWDVFISHASEDKEAVARPLTNILKGAGLQVWLDAFELTLGDSLSRKIDEGLAQSKYGVVILSKNFFEKGWPTRELAGLVARQVGGSKVILPVWHGVDHAYVAAYSPPLADALAISTDKGLPAVADAILQAVQGSPAQLSDNDRARSQTNRLRRHGFRFDVSSRARLVAATTIVVALLLIVMFFQKVEFRRGESKQSSSDEIVELRRSILELRQGYAGLEKKLNTASTRTANAEVGSEELAKIVDQLKTLAETTETPNQEIRNILENPSLSSSAKITRAFNLLLVRQTQELDSLDRSTREKAESTSQPTLDEEVLKLQRVVGSRKEVFEQTQRLISRYNEEAKRIIDQMGR